MSARVVAPGYTFSLFTFCIHLLFVLCCAAVSSRAFLVCSTIAETLCHLAKRQMGGLPIQNIVCMANAKLNKKNRKLYVLFVAQRRKNAI